LVSDSPFPHAVTVKRMVLDWAFLTGDRIALSDAQIIRSELPAS
jgi:hypothetical protein